MTEMLSIAGRKPGATGRPATLASNIGPVAVATALCALLAACGEDVNKPPRAESLVFSAIEDTPVQGWLNAKHPQGKPLTFTLDGSATKGTVTIDPGTGSFIYSPLPDLNGRDSFSFFVTDPKGARSSPAVVSIEIAPVNDAPQIAPIPELGNSAETLESLVDVMASDVDGDTLTVSVTSRHPHVAAAALYPAGDRIVVTPIDYGTATIEVSVTDGSETTATSFEFRVVDVIRRSVLEAPAPATDAVTVVNRADRTVRFRLEHNDFPVFENKDQVVEYVRAQPDLVAGEPFERKLWRFLRDSTNHYYSLVPLQFRQAPWSTLNSLGFGLCGDMATSYVALARTAGYESRVWSLGGHVVPEIKVDNRWQVYDPDLGVYYRNRDGTVAGVEQLAADPTLVSDPAFPIFDDAAAWAYSSVVTEIYATAHDNFVADATLLPDIPEMGGRFEMPPGAKLTYPGRWTEEPIAYKAFGERILREEDLPDWRDIAERHDGATPYPIWFHRQAKLDLPPGWTGILPLPLWLWDIHGQGSISIDGVVYEAGSKSLEERLRYRVPARQLTVLESTDLSLIMQINFRRFDMNAINTVNLTGRDVWALETYRQNIGAHGAGEHRRSNRPVAKNP
jgi:hypothetical protein